MSALTWLELQARHRPDAPALRVEREGAAPGSPLTWAALALATERAAALLHQAGLGAGDRLAVQLPEQLEHVLAIHAAFRLGAVLVPLHARLTAPELAWLLGDCRPRLLVAEATERVHEALTTAGGGGPIPLIPPERLLEGADPADLPPSSFRGDRPATRLYTSGTSGRPKAITATAGQHLASAAASGLNLGVYPDDDWLCCLRLSHMGGLAILLRSVVQGTPVTLMDGFDPAREAEWLAGGSVTLVSLVPTMLRRLLDAVPDPARLAHPRLRAILLGGGPADRSTLERARAAGLPVLSTYGSTETCSQVATVPFELLASTAGGEHPAWLGSAGRMLLGAEIEIRDGAGRRVAPGSAGELWVRGPMVARGPEGDDRFRPDGWLTTGDLGWLDRDGFLWVEGRREDLIVSGGENVYPAEVESVLSAHPAVADCAVFGLADPDWGERVAAAVVLAGRDGRGARADLEDDLTRFCRGRLAPFKVPRRWRVLEELPRTPSGKIRRRELAERPEWSS